MSGLPRVKLDEVPGGNPAMALATIVVVPDNLHRPAH
jgi:hypothetical protein